MKHGMKPVPTPRTAEVVQVVGVRVAVTTPATPVPLRPTGEPVTVTLPVMVSVAFTRPGAVGENATLIVQVLAPARVPVQVPPAAPAGRA